MPRSTTVFLIALLVCPLAAPARADAPARAGQLAITVVDAATGRPTPARIEVADAAGRLHVPADALPAPGRCPDGSEPAWYARFTADTPPPATLRIDMHVQDAATKGAHFYVLDGAAAVELAAGRYQVTAFKGIEYVPLSVSVALEAGKTTTVTLPLARLVDMPAAGWFSADDHVHVARHDAAVNPLLASWMEAEDLHVANLLEMGTYKGTEAAPQYAFGKGGLYQRQRTILAPGQENPRTWTLGHGIVLGARSYIDFRDRYLDYRLFWAEAARQRAYSGYAHWGGPRWAVDLPTGELDFLEVLQIGIGHYDDLYLAWDLGYAIAPTAGTDYQCSISGPPGRVRFYTRVDPPLTYDKWLAALGAGRTFATNGAFLDLTVEGKGIGGAVVLDAPRAVAVEASLRFDPARDEMEALEIVRNGEVVEVVKTPDPPGTLRFAGAVPVDGPSWLAARARGRKVAETTGRGERQASLAHTGAITVRVAGKGVADADPGRAAARGAVTRIDALRKKLDALRAQPQVSEVMNQFDAATLRRDWPLLEEAIDASRRHYEALEGR